MADVFHHGKVITIYDSPVVPSGCVWFVEREYGFSYVMFTRADLAEQLVAWDEARYKPTWWDHVVKTYRIANKAGWWGEQGPPKWWRKLPWR